MDNDSAYIIGKRIILRPLQESDFSDEYLTWLNDPEINKYSQRRPFPIDWDGMRSYKQYYDENPEQGSVLAIVDKENNKHLGNISLVNIHLINRCAEIAILIGNKDYWNKGYASEAIYCLTRHVFNEMNIHKIFAGSFNPAFVKCVEKLGWKKEGEFRERIWSNGSYHDQIWLSILESEFKVLNTYEQ